MMRRLAKTTVLFLCVGILFFSCDQDSLFHDISAEVEPKDPLIEGTPIGLIEWNDGGIYVASTGSKTLHRYDINSDSWGKHASPGGPIGGLAATDNYRYAIIRDSNTLRRFDTTNGWETAASFGQSVQTVYAAGNMVFVGVGKGRGPFSLYCYGDSGSPSVPYSSVTFTFSPGSSIGGLLRGVAWDGADYFIATEGGGIYHMTPAGLVTGPLPKTGGRNVMGIVSTSTISPGYIIGVTWEGGLISFPNNSGSPSDADVTYTDHSGNFTGGLCTWTDSTNSLLLIGVRGSNLTHGYREVNLDTTTGEPDHGVRSPGSAPSTIKSRARYDAALGKHSVQYIYQPTGSSVIFASTAKDGLWSLRDDEWNYEEE